MKHSLLFILIISTFHLPNKIYSQKISEDGVVILHDSLIKGRFGELDLVSLRGWKFSADDDPRYSSSDYDDSAWETINKPLNTIEELPDSWNGFGWFRLKVRLDPSFKSRHLLVGAENSGGLEFYIRDSLILKQGNPSPFRAGEQLFGSIFSTGEPVTLEKGETYQLAIKYSFHDHDLLRRLSETPSPWNFTIAILNTNNLNDIVADSQKFAIVFASSSILLLLVMILHFQLYLKAKDEKGNFWVFLLSFFLLVSTTLMALGMTFSFPDFWVDTIRSRLSNLSIFSAIGLTPLVAHKVLELRTNNFWKYFTAYPVIIFAISLLAPALWLETDFRLSLVLTALFLAISGGLIAIRKARKQKRKDLYVIAVPILAFPVIFVVGNIVFGPLEIQSRNLELIMIFLVVNIIPLGFSVYQAKRFFRMHKHLDQLVFQRTRELEKAYKDLEISIIDLKAAQTQLIQQEKLASLGQLTAGIAHEIKNPLNFVTNFSDVCIELIAEAKSEVKALMATNIKAVVPGNGDDIELLKNLKDLLDTVETNLEKIFEHGNRADGIVRSMLLHSRGGSGKLRPVYFNSLVREYVNLAFHGMRASKNPFDIEIEFHLDDSIGEVGLIKEDFSRVILNLCNNAFDAVREKLKTTSFSPRLEVRTIKAEDTIILEIIDNGTGIPEDIREKILQPFFTTKRGTDGTGLGLSITNDIIKAHGGSMEIKSKIGESSVFRIKIPTIETFKS